MENTLKDSLAIKYVFGYRGSFHNNILNHYENNKFIYSAANSLVVYNNESKAQ